MQYGMVAVARVANFLFPQMHAMPVNGTTVKALANYYIEQEKKATENERLIQLQNALKEIHIDIADIPPVYVPLIKSCISYYVGAFNTFDA